MTAARIFAGALFLFITLFAAQASADCGTYQTCNLIFVTGVQTTPTAPTEGQSVKIDINTFEFADWYMAVSSMMYQPSALVVVGDKLLTPTLKSSNYGPASAYGFPLYGIYWFAQDASFTFSATWDGTDAKGNFVSGKQPVAVVIYAGAFTTGWVGSIDVTASDNAKNLGMRCPCHNGTEPINSATGNLYEDATDYNSGGSYALKFSRSYNSDASVADATLGAHWHDNFDRSIQLQGTSATVYRPDGRQYVFTESNGTWTSDADVPDTLTEQTGSNGAVSGLTYVTSGNVTEQYDASGHLISITPLGGPTQTLSYNSAGQLTTVSDIFGRSLSFSYDSNNRIATMTDPNGGLTQYAYDSNNNLTTVTYPDGSTLQYRYEDSTFPHALTGIIDEDGNRYATWTYDSQGRATSSQLAGLPAVAVTYNSDGSATVTDGLGTPRTYTFSKMFGVYKVTGESRPDGSSTDTNSMSYDANGYLASVTDWRGITTTYVHDAQGRETSRTEAAGTPQARTITTAWDTALNVPTKITGPGNTTTFSYDSQGRLLSRTVRDATTSTTTTYTYNALGEVTSVDGPRTDISDITTYAYNGNNNLATVTDALGHVTTITSYDAAGRPLSYTDPNGLVISLAYDVRGRLTSRDSGGETMQFGYDGVGDLTSVTLPDGSVIHYTYDAARRLTGITDAAGNQLSYTLDAMGNRTAVHISDSSGKLTRVQHWVYDQLSRLAQSIGAANQTIQYQYDADGNETTVTDPNGNITTSSFDALNRLVQQAGPLGVVTAYGYDTQDHLVSVTDADGHTTTYSYDGLGDLLSRTSPDTGTTTYTHDVAGNLLTKTDAKGQTTTYSYDALNRLTGVTYSDGATTTYTYDNCADGIDHLCSSSDGSDTINWSYDRHGRVTHRTDDITVNGSNVRLATGYGYDSAGHLSSMTYPSGLTVAYHYAHNRLSGIDLNGQTYIAGAIYTPFGPVSGWDWSNGHTEQRSYDQDGQLISTTLGPDTRTLTYDPAGNITAFSDANTAQSLSYDALNRLIAASDSVNKSSFSWQYDANGNRLSQGANGTTTSYGIDPGSNRMISVDNTQYQYDADGNLISDGVHTYGYSARNRLTTVDGGNSATYTYNSLGQRVMKQALLPSNRSASGQSHASSNGLANSANTIPTTVLFAYDSQGRLVGEYDATGAAVEETVYFDNVPVATVRSGVPYAIHSDQLGTPRVITDQSENVVWRWDSDPFGATPPNERPSGTGKAFVYNLRFAGQYYDAETGLSYNYFRNYDSKTGRYIESDPIGLNGGLNTYTHVLDNPISYIDSLGLDVTIWVTRLQTTPQSITGLISAVSSVTGASISGYTLEHGPASTFPHIKDGTYKAILQTHSYETGKEYSVPRIRILGSNVAGGQIHNGNYLRQSMGCTLAAYHEGRKSDTIINSKAFIRALDNIIQKDGGKITVMYTDLSGISGGL